MAGIYSNTTPIISSCDFFQLLLLQLLLQRRFKPWYHL
jgi:hypothetical protein